MKCNFGYSLLLCIHSLVFISFPPKYHVELLLLLLFLHCEHVNMFTLMEHSFILISISYTWALYALQACHTNFNYLPMYIVRICHAYALSLSLIFDNMNSLSCWTYSSSSELAKRLSDNSLKALWGIYFFIFMTPLESLSLSPSIMVVAWTCLHKSV